MMTAILGISAFYHDSAAALVVDGRVVAAAQEERFTRKRYDARFPAQATRYCLGEAGLKVADLKHVVFYDKPIVKFERLLQTYLAYTPRGLSSFLVSMPVWVREKLYLKMLLRDELAEIGECSKRELPKLLFTQHHQAHAASAFFPSPFERAAVLCLDGVGEWATTSAWQGSGNNLKPLWEIDFPHSLGLLYSAFTYYAGFRVNSGEYKLMGLAPYGEPRFVKTILDHLVDVKEDGTFRLNLDYFAYPTGLRMTNDRFAELFGGPARAPETPIEQKHMDIARSIQAVTEEIVLKLARSLHRETGEKNLCLAGGVALNCVANGRLLREGPFERLWIQPAAGDAGGSVGAALAAWYDYLDQPRKVAASGKLDSTDGMQGSYLGPQFSDAQLAKTLEGRPHQKFSDEAALVERVAQALSEGQIVGWFQGRMEFGPRSLGARSILGDPRSPTAQSTINLKIKYRESFRPFAPAVLAERAAKYFTLDSASPYMLLVAPLEEQFRKPMTDAEQALFGVEKLNVPRSMVPAVTHVDYSARVQTVHRETNPRFHHLLEAFETLTGCPMLVNTSFNVRGEPIVCTPEDAYRCFMRTELDLLVLGDFVLQKKDQPSLSKDETWKKEFELD